MAGGMTADTTTTTSEAFVLDFDGTITLADVGDAFPHRERLGCPLCGVCKGRVVDELHAAGRRVTFVGDGTSDRCAVGRAERIFAVRGSKLAAECRARGAAAVEFDSFDEI